MKGFVSEEALAEYSRLAAEKLGVDFAEGEVYDFARCMRADGSFYGTSGKCRKGSEAGEKEKEEKQWSPPTGKNRPPENPTAEQITKMSTDELWDGKATYKPGSAGHQAYKNEIDRRRERDEKLKARGVEPKTAGGKKRRATAEAKNAAAAERKAEGNAKRSATAGRARLLKEELEKVKDKMKGASPEEVNRLIKQASDAADKRSKSSGPDELDRRIAAKAREANKLAYEGMKDAERRKKETEERRAKRNEPKKSLLQKLKERIKSKSKEG